MTEIAEYEPFDWDLTSWEYRDGKFRVSFYDGSQGEVPVSHFVTLDSVPESMLAQCRWCVWYVSLDDEEKGIEWEVSEYELFGIINGLEAKAKAQQAQGNHTIFLGCRSAGP